MFDTINSIDLYQVQYHVNKREKETDEKESLCLVTTFNTNNNINISSVFSHWKKKCKEIIKYDYGLAEHKST